MGLTEIPPLMPGAITGLMNYRWPGNVRELENAVERALIVSQGRPLSFEITDPAAARPDPDSPPGKAQADQTLDRLVARHIRQVLAQTRGRVEGERGAARLLGIQPNTLRYKMRKLGIPHGRRAKGLYAKP